MPYLINKFPFNRYTLLPNNSVSQDSVDLICTRTGYGWTVRGSNPGGTARYSAPVQTYPAAHPTSCNGVPGLFPGGKAAEAWR